MGPEAVYIQFSKKFNKSHHACLVSPPDSKNTVICGLFHYIMRKAISVIIKTREV